MGAEAVKNFRTCSSRENREVQNLTKPDMFCSGVAAEVNCPDSMLRDGEDHRARALRCLEKDMPTTLRVLASLGETTKIN